MEHGEIHQLGGPLHDVDSVLRNALVDQKTAHDKLGDA